MEYIIVENGIITAHRCGATKPENAITVPEGFAGYVGMPYAALKGDLTGLKLLSQQVSEGIIEQPEGYKINASDTAFVRMTQSEINTEYPEQVYAQEGSFDFLYIQKTFDREGNFGYFPPAGYVKMEGDRPSLAHKAQGGVWVLNEAKAAELKMSDAKTDRAGEVSRITVDVDGMTFDGDETSQNRMARKVLSAQMSGIQMSEKTDWVLADNTVASVSYEQLAKACALAGQKQSELWVKPYEDAA